MNTLICDLPGVFDTQALNYFNRAANVSCVRIASDFNSMTPVGKKNTYFSGCPNPNGYSQTHKVFVLRRGLIDYVCHFFDHALRSRQIQQPSFVVTTEELWPWLFDNQPLKIRSVIGLWKTAENYCFGPNIKLVNRSKPNTKPLELFPGQVLAPASPRTLSPTYSQELINIAQTL